MVLLWIIQTRVISVNPVLDVIHVYHTVVRQGEASGSVQGRDLPPVDPEFEGVKRTYHKSCEIVEHPAQGLRDAYAVRARDHIVEIVGVEDANINAACRIR